MLLLYYINIFIVFTTMFEEYLYYNPKKIFRILLVTFLIKYINIGHHNFKLITILETHYLSFI